VVNEIDFPVDEEGLGDVDIEKVEICRSDVGNVFE
jgi:hypothetical protein